MKPLTPIKAVALAALAASLALPAAHAKPTAPAKHAPAPKPAQTPADALRKDVLAYQKAYYGKRPVPPTTLKLPYSPALSRISWASILGAAQRLPSDPPVTLDLKEMPIRQALDALFAAAKVNYTIAAGVPDDKDTVTVHLTNVPLAQALDAVLAASDTPLTYTVGGGGIIAVAPRLFGSRFAPTLFTFPHPGDTLFDYRGVASLFATPDPLILGPGKVGSQVNSYKATPPVNLTVPRLIGPTSSKDAADPSVASPPTTRRPADPMPGKTP